MAEAQAPPPQKPYVRFKKKYEINLPNYDEKLFHYGFFLGLNYNRLNINLSDYYIQNNNIAYVTPTGSIGFALGFLLNVRLADQLSFKVIPSVGFYDRGLKFKYNSTSPSFTNATDSIDIKNIETTFIETSFLLKYKSIRRANHRFYLVAGVKPAIRAGGKKPGQDNKIMGYSNFDLTLEYGVGLDLYFQFFKFSPELRFSHGLLNMNTNDNNDWNKSLINMYTHTVTLLFFFE
jgi:hypothetical protein